DGVRAHRPACNRGLLQPVAMKPESRTRSSLPFQAQRRGTVTPAGACRTARSSSPKPREPRATSRGVAVQSHSTVAFDQTVYRDVSGLTGTFLEPIYSTFQ